MRNKRRIAPEMVIPEVVTQEEFKRILDNWFTQGGFEQMSINMDNTATNYAAYRDDLLMYVIEQFYKLDWEKQLKICRESKSPERWCTRVGSLSIKSNSSPFHSQYRKFSLKMRESYDSTTDKKPLWAQDEPTDYSEDMCVKCMKMEIEKFDFYEAMLINAMVFNGYKPKKFAEEYDLDVVSVTNNFYALKKKLQKACKNYR